MCRYLVAAPGVGCDAASPDDNNIAEGGLWTTRVGVRRTLPLDAYCRRDARVTSLTPLYPAGANDF